MVESQSYFVSEPSLFQEQQAKILSVTVTLNDAHQTAIKEEKCMVNSNKESRNPIYWLYVQKSLETVKGIGRRWVKVSSHQMNSKDSHTPYSKQALKLIIL